MRLAGTPGRTHLQTHTLTADQAHDNNSRDFPPRLFSSSHTRTKLEPVELACSIVLSFTRTPPSLPPSPPAGRTTDRHVPQLPDIQLCRSSDLSRDGDVTTLATCEVLIVVVSGPVPDH